MDKPANAKKRILSGMRPTGPLHLGHLVGALKNWAGLQEEYDCLFMVADWHALMSEYENPKGIQENIFSNVIDWFACGIDPRRSTVFVQSHIKEHLELYMVFSLFVPLGWLERCPTYKEQLRQVTNRNLSTYGFLGYPVLQAADILLYKANAVPVGEDQLPHLELTREIGKKFNSLYNKDIFPEPQALLTDTARLMGTDARKMSKSYDNYIALSDTPDVIRKKTRNMFTDPQRIKFTDPGHPQICNVHSYYAVFAPERKNEVDQLCRKAQIGCTDCKKELGEILVKFLEPVQEKRKSLAEDRDRVFQLLQDGETRARTIAAATISEVKGLLGL